MALFYCKKCGRIANEDDEIIKSICDCCDSIMLLVPKEFLDKELDCFFIDDDTEQEFIDNYIKISPIFDPYLFEHRDEILANKFAEFEEKLAHGKAILEENSRAPQCPSCGSSNVSKIGTINRMVSTGLFGLASSKIGKTHQCNNCGTTW